MTTKHRVSFGPNKYVGLAASFVVVAVIALLAAWAVGFGTTAATIIWAAATIIWGVIATHLTGRD